MLRSLFFTVFVFAVVQAKWTQFFTKDKQADDLDGMCMKKYTNGKVYCTGYLIEAVNFHHIYNDSKEFVDKPLKKPAEEINKEYVKRFGTDITKVDPTKLLNFVNEFFYEPTAELRNCTPPDWKDNPPKIMQIQDEKLRNWALELHKIWKTLCRTIDPEVKKNPDMHSIIWVDNHFIVPGGRFREWYYSDSYWIIRGLLISDMVDTAKAIVRNFASIVREIGFIPNGGRIYYTNRSQPPLLTSMVYIIYESTNDLAFVKELLPDLEKEFNWWQEHRRFPITSQAGKQQTVYFYKTDTKFPRPETMWADLQAADKLPTKAAKDQFFESSASAAESGWDFSSRWFADQKTLSTMETAKIAPVDLNSYMCGTMSILGYLFREAGNDQKASYYETMHQNFVWVNDEVFYNKTAGGWYDFHTQTSSHRVHNYLSGSVPLFTNCYSILDENKPRRLFDNLQKGGFFDFPGGVPASLIKDTDQQWDYPNGWAPSNHMLIEGLRQSSDPIMQDKAFEVAKKWIYSNYWVYQKTKHMYEKYNVIAEDSQPGHGGEYSVVIGFGWSNGVILDLLYTYYDRIEAPRDNGNVKSTPKPSNNNDNSATSASTCTLLSFVIVFVNFFLKF